MDIPAISKTEEDKSVSISRENKLEAQNQIATKLPPLVHGFASKEHKIFPTKLPSLVETIAQKGHPPSDKVSLLPQSAFREHSISFLTLKTQEVSSLKLPGTIAALEMLQRPYTINPFWTGKTQQNVTESVTKRKVTSNEKFSTMEKGSLLTSTMTKSPETLGLAPTALTITPSTHETSVIVTPLRVDSELYEKGNEAMTRRLLITNGKKQNVSTAPIIVLGEQYFISS